MNLIKFVCYLRHTERRAVTLIKNSGYHQYHLIYNQIVLQVSELHIVQFQLQKDYDFMLLIED